MEANRRQRFGISEILKWGLTDLEFLKFFRKVMVIAFLFQFYLEF